MGVGSGVGMGCGVGDGVTLAYEKAGIPAGATCAGKGARFGTAAVGRDASGGGIVTTAGVATHAASNDRISDARHAAMMTKRVNEAIPTLLRTKQRSRLLIL
jgi:hypothetical protein